MREIQNKNLLYLFHFDFVILEMPEDDNLSINLGRPFLNTAGAVINCTEGKVTFNVKGKEHTIHFPRKNTPGMLSKSVNSIEVRTIMIGSIEVPLPAPPPKYDTHYWDNTNQNEGILSFYFIFKNKESLLLF